MNQIYHHLQNISETKYNRTSECEIKLFFDGKIITIISLFDLHYVKYGNKQESIFEESLILDIETGDITVLFNAQHNYFAKPTKNKVINKLKVNNFDFLQEISRRGFCRGERHDHFWGGKYQRALNTIFSKIKGILLPKISSEYIREQILNEKWKVNKFYDIFTLYFLDKKEIKGNDLVLFQIQESCPKKKWLKKNDNKFVPAVLDSYGIKSKYLIKYLSMDITPMIRITSLNFICKLFGDDYLRYLKLISWQNEAKYYLTSKKVYELKNDKEKKSLVKIFNEWENSEIKDFIPLIVTLDEMLSVRKFVESFGLSLEFNPKNLEDFYLLFEKWKSYKSHYKRGYKVKIDYSEEFINKIQEKIIIGDDIFTPKVLITEEDFNMEGTRMKNCMAQQFSHGSFHVYISLDDGKKRINAQYHNGKLEQHYGTSNTSIMSYFYPALDVLTERMSEYSKTFWPKIKYDFR